MPRFLRVRLGAMVAPAAPATHAGTGPRRWVWVALTALLLLSLLWALGMGRFGLRPSAVAAILLSGWLPLSGLDWDALLAGLPGGLDAAQRVIWQVRMPRLLLACLAGTSLAICGAALQGAFRNVLVGPQVLGISSGAALGGCLAILLFTSLPAIMGGAFIGGLVAVTAVYLLARTQGQTTMLMLVLAGVVTSAFFAALISLVTYFADPNDTLPAIVFWLMGSFATASYAKLGAVLLPMALGMALLLALRFRINVLSLGDEAAHAAGLAVEPLRWAILACVTLVVSSSVAVSGTVGWVGLVVPHFARMVVGPDHRVLLPASALMGGVFMVVVDTLARTLTSAEIPLGVITALVGAPVFAWLLRRTQAREWRHD
ncbi:MAG: iron ABC transporter permease [Burkholderiaceae bacterium]|nr:iron ABC transporter permease [Burkholderiaceae bacterium]